MTRVSLYTKSDCCLCDDARAALERVRADLEFDYEELYIDGRADLEAEFGTRVPVIAINGEPTFELRVDERALRVELERVSMAGGLTASRQSRA